MIFNNLGKYFFQSLTRVNGFFVLLLFFLLPALLHATYIPTQAGQTNTVTQTATGITASMTITENIETGVATWHHTQTAAGGGAWVASTTGEGGGDGTYIHDHGPAGPADDSGTWMPEPGSWWRIVARVSATDGNLYDTIGYWQAGTPDYYADFLVPKNEGIEPVTITVYQNGNEITSYVANPGDGPNELHVTGLEAEGLITVVYGYGVYSKMPGGTVIFTPNVDFEVAGGCQPTAAAEPPDPTKLSGMRKTLPLKQEPEPVEPTPPQTPQTPPTPVPPPSAPTTTTPPTRGPLGVPYGTPTGEAPVTKANIEDVANKISARLDEADQNRQASDDKTTEAVDKVAATVATQSNANLAAVNNLREENVAGTTKVLAAAAGSQAALEGILHATRRISATSDAMNITLGQIELATKVPSQAEKDQSLADVVQAATDFNDSVTAATNIQPTTGEVAEDNTDAGSGIGSVYLPGGGNTVSISLNPLNNSKVQEVASLLRALIGWSVLFALIAWTYMQIPIWMTDALRGGSGFTAWRAATGAIPLIGVAVLIALVLAGGALILTAPTIMWAYADPLMMGQAGNAIVDIRSVITSVAGTDAGKIISLLDAVCPTGLCMTAAINYITLRIGGQAICAGLIAFSKVLAS